MRESSFSFGKEKEAKRKLYCASRRSVEGAVYGGAPYTPQSNTAKPNKVFQVLRGIF